MEPTQHEFDKMYWWIILKNWGDDELKSWLEWSKLLKQEGR